MSLGRAAGKRAHGIADGSQARIAAGGVGGELGEVAGTQHHEEPGLIGLGSPLPAGERRDFRRVNFRRLAEAVEGLVAQVDIVRQLDLAIKLVLRRVIEQLPAGDERCPVAVFGADAAFGEFQRGAVSPGNLVLGFLLGAVGGRLLLGLRVTPLFAEAAAHPS